ncbi:MAG: triple tyrosine motif-containing protein [Sphingomonas sp.]
MPAFLYPSDNFRRRGKTLFDKDGNLWIARRKDGVERLRTPSALGPSKNAEPLLEYRAEDGLTSDTTHKIFEDREGNIWVGTALGLDRFRNANIALDHSLTRPAAYGDILFADAQGAVYIGQRDTVYRVPPGGEPHPVLSGISEPEAICAGPDRSIWIVLPDEVAVLQQGHRRTVSLPKNLEDGIYDCGLDRSGRFWMTAGGSGLFRLTAHGWEHLAAQLPNRFSPTQMVHDRSGNLWLMWGTGTVARLDAQKPAIVDVQRKETLGALRTITPAWDGLLLGYDRGIGRLDRNGFSYATVAQIPALTRSMGLIDTGAGETWVFGELGVSRIMTADLDRAFRDRRVRVSARTFGFLDGLPDLRARARNRGLVRGGDGRIWASTDAGTVWLDPARLSFNAMPPQVTVGSLTASGRRYLDPVSLRLPPGASQITIGFAAFSLAMPERVRVRYRLEGQDRGWINPGTRRQAFYTNLGPGKYRFRVIAANEDGVWNNRGATLDFTVLPTFFESIWFKLIVAILLFALLAALYVLRLRMLTTRMQSQFDIRIKERERIARELHDTLLQGFQGWSFAFRQWPTACRRAKLRGSRSTTRSTRPMKCLSRGASESAGCARNNRSPILRRP